MEFLKAIFLPINDKHLYNTYIGIVLKVTNITGIRCIYFERYPSIKFYMPRDFQRDQIKEGMCILISYREHIDYGIRIDDDIISFFIKTIDIVPNYSINSLRKNTNKFFLEVHCLYCGDNLQLDKFEKCSGTVVRHYCYNDTIMEDEFMYNACNICYCSRRHYPGWKCKKQMYRCTNCYVQRVVEFE